MSAAPSAPAAAAIVVMGVSGSGKTTLATRLAAALGCPFLEGDDYHAPESREKMRRGEALTDADRTPWLDRLGHALASAIAADGRAVATCSALKHSYRDRLAAAAAKGGAMRFVLLDADRALLADRIAGRKGHYMPASLLDSQLATLERPEASEHVLTLDATRPPGDLADAALAWLAGGTAAQRA